MMIISQFVATMVVVGKVTTKMNAEISSIQTFRG